jgi:hypothetical protein
MGELIEHVPYAALEDFISSAARVLSQGGRLEGSPFVDPLAMRAVAVVG